jgi:hypothetical protein
VLKYDSDYLKIRFSWNGGKEDPRPLCIVCCRILAKEIMQPNKICKHIETKHLHLGGGGKLLKFFERKLEELNMTEEKLLHFTKISEKAIHVPYLISLRIKQASKLHTVGGSVVLPVIKDAVGVLFGDRSSKDVERILLSNNPVARRIDEISRWTEDELFQRVGVSKFFLLQLDKSTEVYGLSQLLSFVCYM